jgi:hypothetical protein
MNTYERFLNICNELAKLSPWNYLENEDYCQMALNDYPHPILVSVMGINKMNYGFLICTNPLQSNYLLTYRENIKEGRISSYRRCQYYSMNYEAYQDISPADKKRLRSVLGSLKRDSSYPVLKKFIWGMGIVDVDERELADTCGILEHLFMLLKNVHEGKIKKNGLQAEYPTRVYNPTTKMFDNFYMSLTEEYFLINPVFKMDRSKCSVFEKVPSTSLIVEYDMMYVPITIKESGSMPLLLVVADAKSKMILHMNLLQPQDGREISFAEEYLNFLRKFGICKEVRVRDSIDKKIIDSLDIPNKPPVVVKPLVLIDEIIEDFMRNY